MRRLGNLSQYLEGDARLTNVVLCALGLGLVVLAHQFVAEMKHFSIGFSGVSLLSVMLYLGAVGIVRTQPVNRATFGIVVGFAVAMHAITYLAEPFLSTDIYRYVWDGIVQHAHISPYRYVPGNAALSFLRQPNQEIFDNINRRDYARTIYPPVAQMLYWVATYFGQSVAAMKLMMLAFEGVGAWALVKALQRMGRPRAEVLMMIWCPLLVWEIGDAGHVDAVIIGFLALAMLCRMREQPVLTGLFLGCAVMTKFYPLVLVPALYQRRDWKMPATLVAVCAIGYAVYARVGWLVFGFLGGYQKEEGIETGARYFLLDFARTRMRMHGLPNGAFYVLCAVVLGGIALWAWRYATTEHVPPKVDGERPAPAFAKAAMMLALAMMLLFSPHYPWYVLWLVPLMTLAPNLPAYVYVLGLYFGLTTGLALPGPKMFLLNERLYGAVAVAMLLQIALRRWPVMKRLRSRDRMQVREPAVAGVAAR